MSNHSPKKRQQTKWIFRYFGGHNTGIQIGWVYNRHKDILEDKVAIQIKSANGNWILNFTLDEALAIISGLGKTLTYETVKNRIRVSS